MDIEGMYVCAGGYEGFENEAALTFVDNLDIDVCARGMNATALLMKSNSSSVVAAMAREGLRVILEAFMCVFGVCGMTVKTYNILKLVEALLDRNLTYHIWSLVLSKGLVSIRSFTQAWSRWL